MFVHSQCSLIFNQKTINLVLVFLYFAFLGTIKSLNYKYDALKYKLKKGITVDVLRKENFDKMVKSNIQPEVQFRVDRTGVKNLQDMVVSESFEKIKGLPGVGDEQRLSQQNFNSQKKLAQQKGRIKSKKVAGKILGKVGNGVEKLSTALDIAQGGVDTAAGSDMIKKARELRSEGHISEGEYNEMIRNGRLRVAQGSFGLANGMQNVVKFVGKRVEKNILKKAGTAGVKLLKQTKRFGPFIGGAISVGTSVVSMAKNAIAASDAAKQGIVGKAVVYGVMAAVDGITAILDGVSVVLDFVPPPPPLSPIIDLVSTILQVINTILGFFADLIDFRTTAQRVHDEFETYINSEAFKTYVNNMAEGYKNRGFDIFKYYVDADVAGIEADKETLQAERKTITKCLTEKAKEDFENKQLRVALVDATSFGKTLKGRQMMMRLWLVLVQIAFMAKKVMTYYLDEAEVTPYMVVQEMITSMVEQEGTLSLEEKVTIFLSVSPVLIGDAKGRGEMTL